MSQTITSAERVAQKKEIAALPFDQPMYRFTVAQYHRMNEEGVFPADVRTELLDGCVVLKMTPKPPHAVAVTLAHDAFAARLPEEWSIRTQQPITLKRSEPEPDVAAVRGPVRRYAARHPGVRDIGLLVEVGDASLLNDRRKKGSVYAEARIPVYWIINLVERVIEVYTSPRSGKEPAYQQRTDYASGSTIPLSFAGKDFGGIPVDELLP